MAQVTVTARKSLLKKIDTDLDNVCNENLSKGLIFSGKYGEGKTHLLQTVFSMAHERNMVVSMVPIGKENPLDKLYLFYQKIIAGTYLPGHEQPGVLSELDKISPLSNVSFKPFYTINPFRLLACVGDLFSSDAFFGKHSREHTLVEPRNQRLHRCPIVCLRTG